MQIFIQEFGIMFTFKSQPHTGIAREKNVNLLFEIILTGTQNLMYLLRLDRTVCVRAFFFLLIHFVQWHVRERDKISDLVAQNSTSSAENITIESISYKFEIYEMTLNMFVLCVFG